MHKKELEEQRREYEKTDGILRRARQAKTKREIADSLIEQIHQFQDQEAMNDDEDAVGVGASHMLRAYLCAKTAAAGWT